MKRSARSSTLIVRGATLVSWILAVTTPAAPGTPAAPEVAFERHDLDIGSAQHQTVLTGFLLGGAVADIAVVDVGEDGDPRLRIYAMSDDAWEPELETTLSSGVSFVDVAGIDGRDRLITYSAQRTATWSGSVAQGRLSWFDPESETEHELVAVTPDFTPPVPGGIPHVDVTRDLNGDGHDDLVVPVLGGFRVFVQTGEGGYADPVTIAPSTRDRIYGTGGYRHDPWAQGGVHEMDYDRDGRGDLVVWERGRFKVHLQDERGLFAPHAVTFTIDTALDGGHNPCARRPEHGFDAFRACYEADHSALTMGDEKERVVHGFADLNGDGVDDLIVYTLEGKGVFSVHSTYEVHFGAPAPDGGTEFSPDVGAAIPSKDVQIVMEMHDFDGNGETDMMLTTIHIGFFKVLGGLVTRSMSVDVEFYRMEGGTYPDEPDAARKIKIDLSPGEPGKEGASYGSVLIGDVNGDGRPDLVVGKGLKGLRVFPGVAGPDLFARQPHKVAVAIPNDEQYTWLTDLDRDGKQDIVVHQPSARKPHRLTTLISR